MNCSPKCLSAKLQRPAALKILFQGVLIDKWIADTKIHARAIRSVGDPVCIAAPMGCLRSSIWFIGASGLALVQLLSIHMYVYIYNSSGFLKCRYLQIISLRNLHMSRDISTYDSRAAREKPISTISQRWGNAIANHQPPCISAAYIPISSWFKHVKKHPSFIPWKFQYSEMVHPSMENPWK